MFSWLNNDDGRKRHPEIYNTVVEGLKKIYKAKILPLEEHYLFHDFHSPPLDDPDFESKPMILLVGQYSTGKTTFIRYLLERDFPGIRIGPEPYDGPVHRRHSMTIIDTPGILSGEKQRVDRGYDFTGVLEWFAERVDRIILLFDAHKLDISDEFRRSIEALRGHDDKIRIVLNKADMVDHQQLMRVYGALMWSLGKVLNTPEVARVYIGSFWDQPLRYDSNRKLFEAEEQDLFNDIQGLPPRNAALRKLNDLIKRARLAKVHAHIISSLRKEMPSMFGKDSKKKELIKGLGNLYAEIQREQQISPGDFPDLREMQEKLAQHDFTKFHALKPRLLETTEQRDDEQRVKGGAFDGLEQSPFGYGRGEGVDAGSLEPDWIVARERFKYDELFSSLGPVDGKISGAAAKGEMVKSKLPNSVLGKVWKLSDLDKDGMLDADEFALAMHLISVKVAGHDLPTELPEHLVPPSKRPFAAA
ncbi:hypothetical protein MTO96_001560 [Rhipicephalus appendiculatus]